MFKNYFLNIINILNIIIISIIMFCIILGYNILVNLNEQAKYLNLPENRTLIITFLNYEDALDFLNSNKYVADFKKISYEINDNSKIEKFEVVIDKYDNIELFEKQLDKDIFFQKKYDNLVFSNYIANILYKIIKMYIIIVFLILTLINYFFVSKIISNEFKFLAILKSIGFTILKIMQYIIIYILIDLICSLFISTFIFILFKLAFESTISNILEIENVINITFKSYIYTIMFIALSSSIALIGNIKKIYKLSPMILFKES